VKPFRCLHCLVDLEETDELVGNGLEYRVHRCPKCGFGPRFLKDPVLDGSYAQRHKSKDGGFCVSGMADDPDCSVFHKQASAKSRRGAAPPVQEIEPPPPDNHAKPGDIIFVEDDKGNRTHRWHWGRGCWIRLRSL